MMKVLGLISLVLFCVFIAQFVDGGKRHHKRAMGNVRSEGKKHIAPKVIRKLQKTVQANLEAAQADNETTTEGNQDKGALNADGTEEQDKLVVQAKHRRGHKGPGAVHFRRKDESKHNHAHHKHGFHKRNHGKLGRRRNNVKIDKENLRREILALNSNMTEEQLKRLIKVIKRGRHMRKNHEHKRQEEKNP